MGGSYFDMRSFDTGITESPEKKEIKKTNALIIDDSILVANQLKKILINGDIAITGVASSGADAIEIYGEKLSQVDFILLDESISGKMNSLSILKKILQLSQNAAVIMVCRMGREEQGQKAVELGSKGCIFKPLEEKSVIQLLNEIIN